MSNPLFFGKVGFNNNLHLENRDDFDVYLTKLTGQEVQISIEKRKKKRTGKQNDYLWGGIYKTISLDTGHTVNELHNIFGSMFLSYQFEFNGKLIPRVKSTTELTTVELSDYIRDITIEVANMGITLPTSDEWEQK